MGGRFGLMILWKPMKAMTMPTTINAIMAIEKMPKGSWPAYKLLSMAAANDPMASTIPTNSITSPQVFGAVLSSEVMEDVKIIWILQPLPYSMRPNGLSPHSIIFFLGGRLDLKCDGDEVTDWLMAEDNPTVRYLTLRHLLRKRETDGEVLEARESIMSQGPVPKILAKQLPEGNWGRPEDFYMRSKYKGTVWNLILLAELHADPEDQRVRRACEFVLNWSQDRSSGGFAYRGSGERGGNRSAVISCLTGNMVFSLIRLGYLEDERVQQGLDWIARYMRFSLEPMSSKEWPYMHDRCWHDHTCRSGAVKALKALVEVPKGHRSAEMRRTIEEGAAFLLTQHIFRKGPGTQEISCPDWLELGFPLMWNTDILEILDILTRLGYQDTRMHDALNLVLSKRQADGRWLQRNRFEGKFLIRFERSGGPSKWVTLRAIRMLDTMPR